MTFWSGDLAAVWKGLALQPKGCRLGVQDFSIGLAKNHLDTEAGLPGHVCRAVRMRSPGPPASRHLVSGRPAFFFFAFFLRQSLTLQPLHW